MTEPLSPRVGQIWKSNETGEVFEVDQVRFGRVLLVSGPKDGWRYTEAIPVDVLKKNLTHVSDAEPIEGEVWEREDGMRWVIGPPKLDPSGKDRVYISTESGWQSSIEVEWIIRRWKRVTDLREGVQQ